MTKAMAIEAAERNAADAAMFRAVLADVLAEVKPDGRSSFRDDQGALYAMSLYRSTAPHGGIVLTQFRAKGQATSLTVEYLDDLRARSIQGGFLMANAVGTLISARYDAERAVAR